jgi:hypothetical protein
MHNVPDISYLDGEFSVRLISDLVERDPLNGRLTEESLKALERRLYDEIKQTVAQVFQVEGEADVYDILPDLDLTRIESHWYDDDDVTELRHDTRYLSPVAARRATGQPIHIDT